jgi:hypothetical protein
MVGPNYKTPQASVEAQWMGVPSSSRQRTKIAQAYWWKCFRDPVLDRLIKTAYANSLSLQETGVRILQARAQLNQAIGNLFPQQQGLSGAVNYTRLSTPERAFVPAGLTPNYVIDKVLFSSSWEIDFWGKYRRSIESDRATFFGNVASYDDALVTLIADVATSYVNIRTLEERIQVAARNAETQRQSYQLAEAQFKSGETDELDMRQAETLVRQTEAQIPHLQNTLNQTKNGLGVQLGVTPDEVDRLLAGPNHIPVASGEVAAGIDLAHVELQRWFATGMADDLGEVSVQVATAWVANRGDPITFDSPVRFQMRCRHETEADDANTYLIIACHDRGILLPRNSRYQPPGALRSLHEPVAVDGTASSVPSQRRSRGPCFRASIDSAMPSTSKHRFMVPICVRSLEVLPRHEASRLSVSPRSPQTHWPVLSNGQPAPDP